MSRATEDTFLGALLGVAIGDALGLPVTGMDAASISRRHGAFTGYLSTGEDGGDDQPAGQISDKTDTVLCIVESLTTNDGLLDPININARLGFLIEGTSRQWMSDAVVHGIEDAAARDGLVSEELASDPDATVAVRGVAVGLLHTVGAYDAIELARDARTVTRLTHGGDRAARPVIQVAEATCAAARFGDDVARWDALFQVTAGGELERRIAALVNTVRESATFEDAVLAVVREGGEASALGAVAGGIAGARFGASGIPQQLIDDLDARIYLSMAAPWFYRTVMRRAGTVIDLRMIE
jgi:ADP-ribosyl-[dinitrogen reductase] hydrolase